MLTDKLGCRFHYLRLSVTDVGNFRCSYCLPHGYQPTDESAHLSKAEAATVVRAFIRLGTRKVRLTGAEPSLRRDLPDIIDDWHSAGLDQLNISIDTLRRDEFAGFTGHDCLARVFEGVARARVLGVKAKVNAVLLQDGAERRLAEFLAWQRGTPVTLRYIALMRTGDNRDYFASNHLRGAAVELQQLPRTEDAGPAREYAHPDYLGESA